MKPQPVAVKLTVLLQTEYEFTFEDLSQKHWSCVGGGRVSIGQSQHPRLARVSTAKNAVNVNRPQG